METSKRICNWIKSKELDKAGYKNIAAATNLIDEALEMLYISKEARKTLSKKIVDDVIINHHKDVERYEDIDEQYVAGLDSAGDAIIYCHDFISRIIIELAPEGQKYNIDYEKYVSEVLNIIMTANETKNGEFDPDLNKATKGEGFIAPEPELLKLVKRIKKGELL